MNPRLTFVLGLLVTACGSPEALTPEHDAVVKHFQSEAEPTAKDAMWTDPTTFKVGVFSDGTNRSGYASYVCEVLYERGFKGRGVWVQVIDMASILRKDTWKKLGEAHCH